MDDGSAGCARRNAFTPQREGWFKSPHTESCTLACHVFSPQQLPVSLQLNLKFEVEVLCKNLSVELKVKLTRKRRVYSHSDFFVISSSVVSPLGCEDEGSLVQRREAATVHATLTSSWKPYCSRHPSTHFLLHGHQRDVSGWAEGPPADKRRCRELISISCEFVAKPFV